MARLDQVFPLEFNQRPAQTVEIGNSYIHPDARGTGFNGRLKKLMIDHAFGVGIRRIEFRIDERNKRSQAAVAKLGCTKEGVLRSERNTLWLLLVLFAVVVWPRQGLA